ncbi:acyloxyacyl hydrolase [Saccharicrinis sp. FJH54]|uniref:acyloxyacyl hydrolase n=1 Tax=Saccharicrinis sp. FJH54 TaxID=3344665 RepID=UPI0035D50154
MRSRAFHIILFLASTFMVGAQNTDLVGAKRNSYISVNLFNSHLWAHYPELEKIAGFHHVLDVRYFYKTNGDKYWHWAYDYPKIGVGLNAGQFTSPEIGKTFAGYVFGTFPVYKFKNFKVEWDVCTGLGWVENIYDPLTNPNNIGVSTHLNAYLDLNLNTTFKITNRFNGFVGAGISHFSNGAGKKPNMGLNMLGVRTGIIYRLEDELIEPCERVDYPEINKKWGLDIRYGAGKLSINDHVETYLAQNLQFLIAKRFTKRHRLGVAFDLVKDNSLKWKQYLLDGEHSDLLGPLAKKLEGKEISLYQGGILVSSEFILRHLSLVTQFGYMAFYTYDSLPIYERFGVRYIVAKGIFLDMSLRAQGNKAKEITWGIGYAINRGLD